MGGRKEGRKGLALKSLLTRTRDVSLNFLAGGKDFSTREGYDGIDIFFRLSTAGSAWCDVQAAACVGLGIGHSGMQSPGRASLDLRLAPDAGIWHGLSHRVDLSKLPREPRRVEERPEVEPVIVCGWV